jgi:uncharacterized protein (UPF0335 family)
MTDTDGGVINRDTLRNYVERIAHLHDERDILNTDIREVYKEAKEAGEDTTVLREIVKEWRTDADARQSRYRKLDAMRNALGMLADTPLGDAAMHRTDPHADAMQRALDDEPPLRRGRGRPRKQRPLDFLPGDEVAGTA